MQPRPPHRNSIPRTLHRTAALGLLAALIAVVPMGCSSGDLTSPLQVVFPTSNVSYSQHVAPYLQLSCNTAGCHDAPNAQNMGVTLTSWVGVRDKVVPKDTLASALVSVMFAREYHAGTFLATANQRNGIKMWVLEGALNN